MRKQSRCELRAKTVKGGWVRNQSGEIDNVKHRCTLAALQMPGQSAVSAVMYTGQCW